MKMRTIAMASSIILRIIATIHNCLIILISGMHFVGFVSYRSWTAFWLWPIGFAVINLLAIWLPVQLIGTALKKIIRIIVTIIDFVLLPFAFLLFVALNMVESHIVLTFFLVLLFIGFAVINILAIWVPVLVLSSATKVENKEPKHVS